MPGDASTHGARHGGHLVAESLRALGAEVAFGLPGVHALASFEGLRATDLRLFASRTELAAAFAADGYARSTGRPAPLLLSTGPGTLISLGGLMEAASAYVPVVAIASQISSDLLGRRRGALHELSDQLATVRPIVKAAERVKSTDEIPDLLADAWRIAQTPPPGPVFVEVPHDLLDAPATRPAPDCLPSDPPPSPPPTPQSLALARKWLAAAASPLIIAGSGVLRAGAWEELRRLAEALDAPVLMTYMGKGALAPDHPLAVGSACEEPAWQRAAAEADLVVCLGSELGSETSGQYRLRLPERVIQVDASPERIAATYGAHAVIGDLKRVLDELLEGPLPARASGGRDRAARARSELERALRPPGRIEPDLLDAIAGALPNGACHAWDMTIMGYWAASALPVRGPREFLYPLGSGTLGYAFPAALGAAIASGRPSLAVAGDGGISYGLQELAAAKQHDLPTTLLIVDDGGYGVLREYQARAYGRTFAVDLRRPDFVALATAFGIPARRTAPGTIAADLREALAAPGPSALILPARPASPPSFE